MGIVVRPQPNARYVFDDSKAACDMIRAGLGVGYVPSWVGMDERRQGLVVEVTRDWRSREVSPCAVRIDKRLTPARVLAVQNFIVEITRTPQEEFAALSAAA